jgi:hypothetical protein
MYWTTIHTKEGVSHQMMAGSMLMCLRRFNFLQSIYVLKSSSVPLLTESSEHTTEVHLCVNLSVDHEDLKAHFTRSPISKHFEDLGILKLPDQNLGNS